MVVAPRKRKTRFIAYALVIATACLAILQQELLWQLLPGILLLASMGMTGYLLFSTAAARVPGRALSLWRYQGIVAGVQLLFFIVTIAVWQFFSLQTVISSKLSAYNLLQFLELKTLLGPSLACVLCIYFRGTTARLLPNKIQHNWEFVYRNYLLGTIQATNMLLIIVIAVAAVLLLVHLVTGIFATTAPMEAILLSSTAGFILAQLAKKPMRLWMRHLVSRKANLGRVLLYVIIAVAMVWTVSYYCIYEFADLFAHIPHNVQQSFLKVTQQGPALLLWAWFFLAVPFLSAIIYRYSAGRSFLEIFLASLLVPSAIWLLPVPLHLINLQHPLLQIIAIVILLAALYYCCRHIRFMDAIYNNFMVAEHNIKQRSLLKLLRSLTFFIMIFAAALLMHGWLLVQLLSVMCALLLLPIVTLALPYAFFSLRRGVTSTSLQLYADLP
ncbi:MAG: hypothetical protein COC15_03920 [Legionellales bacterium]|nr:MAG: hypothetical protein COC15_03920 [Legionellales bacterium]